MVEITYLTYHQINKPKWDACIDKAADGLIYGYSFYLDAMAKNWDALVLPAWVCLENLLLLKRLTHSCRQFLQNLNTGIFILTPAIFLSLPILICTIG